MNTEAAATCTICDGTDPLGLGLCPSCMAAPDGDRSFIFLDPRSSRRDQEGDDDARTLLGPAADRDASGSAVGAGPLIAVPAPLASPLLRAFAEHGLSARALPASRALLAMPAHFFVMVVCILLAGMVAGIVARPSFLWLSPLVAGGLLFLAHRAMLRPALTPPAGFAWPAPLHADLTATVLTLAEGPARARLTALARIARPLAADLAASNDPADVRSAIVELLAAACETARETDRLGRSADVMRSSLIWTAEVAGDEAQALAARTALRRCAEASDMGLARLADAVAALGRIDAETAGLDGPVGSQLQDLTRGLEAAARVHAETAREVDRLLG